MAEVVSIQIDDILGFLVADTLTPSTMGAQLERLQFGLYTTSDPFRARDDAESRILEQAEILRTMDSFAAVTEFRPATSKAQGYKTLERIQRCATNRPYPCQGAIALHVLKAYQRRATQSQERGLVEVYGVLRHIAPSATPTFDGDHDAVQATQVFREGKASRARQLAAAAYADALLALGYFLNRRQRNATHGQ